MKGREQNPNHYRRNDCLLDGRPLGNSSIFLQVPLDRRRVQHRRDLTESITRYPHQVSRSSCTLLGHSMPVPDGFCGLLREP